MIYLCVKSVYRIGAVGSLTMSLAAMATIWACNLSNHLLFLSVCHVLDNLGLYFILCNQASNSL